MIYLAGVYFYSIWITIHCDSWSKKLFDIYDLEQRGDVDDEEEEEGDEEEENEAEDAAEEGESELNEEEAKESEIEMEIEVEVDDDDQIIPGGKNIKYYILLIAGINTVVNIVFEWVIMRLINNCYENIQIKKYKKEIENEKRLKESNKNEEEIKDVKIYKYQRVYYYDRRKRMKANV